jgi:hypothetical protein
MPTPAPNTVALLRIVITTWRELITELNRGSELDSFAVTGSLSHGVLIENGYLDRTPPWNTRPITSQLRELLDVDPYLRATCIEPFRLALALELILDHYIQIALNRGSQLDEAIVRAVVEQIYLGEYRRKLYFRLYNVVVEEPPIALDGLSAIIDTRAPGQIPGITGETDNTSALHRDGTGNAFLIFEDNGTGDEMEWWRQQWEVAAPVLQALRYVKYAVVDMDYAALQYEPEWVDQVRRKGIGIAGRPRPELQEHPYSLTKADQRRLRGYLGLMKKHEALLRDLKPPLRQALLTAGDYYEGHHARVGLPDKLIDLVIALEALFGDRRTDLTFRISMATAVLIGQTTTEIGDIFEFVKRVYNARSRLVHGAQNPFDAKKEKDRVTAADVARLGDLVRQAIVRLAVLLFHGDYNRERDPFLADLLRATFDADLRARLQRRTDVDQLLAATAPAAGDAG